MVRKSCWWTRELSEPLDVYELAFSNAMYELAYEEIERLSRGVQGSLPCFNYLCVPSVICSRPGDRRRPGVYYILAPLSCFPQSAVPLDDQNSGELCAQCRQSAMDVFLKRLQLGLVAISHWNVEFVGGMLFLT